MKILGICHDVWICSAALVVDGEVVSAIPEERLDRQKQSRRFPSLAIARCLKEAGLSLTDIDEIAVGWNPGIDLETNPDGYVAARRWRSEHLMQVPSRFMQLLGTEAAPEVTITGAARDCPPITFVNHYDSHIGNSLFLSPYEEAAIAIIDGRGERQTCFLGAARGIRVEPLAEVRFPHSLGLLYGAVTQFLGFRPDSDEWKVMALASYAPADNEYLEPMRRLIRVLEDGTFEVALPYFEYFNHSDRRMYSDQFVRLFGPPRRRDEPLDNRHQRIAAAAQRVFEETLTRVLRILHRRTEVGQLVVSGGCFMNSVYNGKIATDTPFRDCFISSCPDDSGTSVGAALWLHAQRTGKRPPPGAHSYWGPEYSDEECLAVARKYALPNVQVCRDPAATAADDLAQGRIIGWFQGRMEFGQRALGNRSILLDPRRPDGKDVVNAAVKFRESFRPFAPAILAERTADWFECEPGTRVPLMERVLMFRPDKRDKVPAVVHVDGSGRLQTVDEESPPRYRQLIEAFERQTGVPIVLNTSFNLNGEPVVCSPDDAIRTFYTCALNVLYLGNVRIAK
jgi:carbamoyltransferase